MPFAKTKKQSESMLDLIEHAKRNLVDWTVVFMDGGGLWWWERFFKRGFRHCLAFRYDGAHWVCFHPHGPFTDVFVMGSSELAEILGFIDTKCSAILHIEAWRDESRIRNPWVFTPFTCVEQVKALLGIGKPWIWTPYQLYRYLEGLSDGVFIKKTGGTTGIGGVEKAQRGTAVGH